MADMRNQARKTSSVLALGAGVFFFLLVVLPAWPVEGTAEDKPPIPSSSAPTPFATQPGKPAEPKRDAIATPDRKNVSAFVPVPTAKATIAIKGSFVDGKPVTASPAVGKPVTFQITVTNPGPNAVRDVEVLAQFPASLQHETRATVLKMKIAALAASKSQIVPLVLTPKQAGSFVVNIAVTVPGGSKLVEQDAFHLNVRSDAPPPPALVGGVTSAPIPMTMTATGGSSGSSTSSVVRSFTFSSIQGSFHFKIDPKTPLEQLLPTPPQLKQRFGPTMVEDLTRVPEVTFQKPLAKGLPTPKARELTAHAIAKINHVNQKKTDAFLGALLERRADLAGLPMAMGDACRMSGVRSRHFSDALAMIRRFLAPSPAMAMPAMTSAVPPPTPPDVLFSGRIPPAASAPGGPGTLPGGAPVTPAPAPPAPAVAFAAPAPTAPPQAKGDPTDRFWEQYQEACLGEDRANARSSAADQEHAVLARIAALMQVLAPESPRMREGLVKYLATIAHPEATRALAKLAIFSAEDEVRNAAVAALKVRRERDYTDILVKSLDYPWPAVARRSTAAIVKLERTDLIPQLVAALEKPDPRLPVVKTVNKKQTPVVRELVRINHHRNCLMCHSPGNTGNVSPDVVTAAVPIPGEPLPSFPQGYQNSTPDMLVRVDVTYLRQDFSMRQAVADAHPWPEMQRFDFLVRTRPLSDDEAQEYQEKLTSQEPGVLSPYHRAALAALRDLTGRDTAPTAEAWRKLLKLEKN